MIQKKTKIICTIGPKSETKERLTEMVELGMNVCRLNFSHGDYSEHGARIQTIKEVREETGLELVNYQFRGIVTFISDKWEDEYMCLYTADKYIGEIGVCDEGELVWVEKDKIKDLNIWEGDKIFLRLLAENELFFSLKLEYQGENLINAILNGKEYN